MKESTRRRVFKIWVVLLLFFGWHLIQYHRMFSDLSANSDAMVGLLGSYGQDFGDLLDMVHVNPVTNSVTVAGVWNSEATPADKQFMALAFSFISGSLNQTARGHLDLYTILVPYRVRLGDPEKRDNQGHLLYRVGDHADCYSVPRILHQVLFS